MGKGVLWKANNTTWSKSQAKKFNDNAMSDGKVLHSNGVTWYENYPMEQEFTQDFPCTWTQGYTSGGTKLWAPSWGDHIYSGGGDGFKSFIGFDRNAIQNFVGSGQILYVKLLINLKETSLNGSPIVNFYPHDYGSAPASWSGSGINTNYNSQHSFPNKAYGGYWKDLTANHVKNPSTGVFFQGIAVMPKSNTEWDWAVFNGKASYSSKLQIKVLK